MHVWKAFKFLFASERIFWFQNWLKSFGFHISTPRPVPHVTEKCWLKIYAITTLIFSLFPLLFNALFMKTQEDSVYSVWSTKSIIWLISCKFHNIYWFDIFFCACSYELSLRFYFFFSLLCPNGNWCLLNFFGLFSKKFNLMKWRNNDKYHIIVSFSFCFTHFPQIYTCLCLLSVKIIPTCQYRLSISIGFI